MKKTLSLLLAMALCLALLCGCGKKETPVANMENPRSHPGKNVLLK